VSDRVSEACDRLDSILMPVARMRIDTLGVEDSGAYNYYDVRVGRGSLFVGYERALAAALIEPANRPSLVHEIGVGWGQLSYLLAALDIDAVALELDRRRYVAGAALHAVIEAAAPPIAQRARILHERFPAPDLEPEGATVIATNMVFTTSPTERKAIVGAIARYRSAILDVDRFLVQGGRTAEERALVLSEFDAAGMTGEPFLDVGSDACFYRFTRR